MAASLKTQSVGFLETLLMYFHDQASSRNRKKTNKHNKLLFLQVDKIIDNYWKLVPAKKENILDLPVVINPICLCDVITYRNILAILVPRPSECMPDR